MFLPVWVPGGPIAAPWTLTPKPRRHGAEAPPYLPVVGPPPLRFQTPAPPPDLATRPVAAAPPKPANDTGPAKAVAAAVEPPRVPVSVVQKPHAVTPGAAPAPIEAAAKPPVPILKDTVKPAVRPEDFLPYFLFPGSEPRNVEPGVAVPATPPAPAPGSNLPPSSATYTQKPE